MPLAIESNDVGFSQRAGTSALLQALRSGRSTLFVASDAPLGKPASAQELSYGAGAAAFALGAERVIARLLGSGSRSEENTSELQYLMRISYAVFYFKQKKEWTIHTVRQSHDTSINY